jgi:hypothetical protein
MILTNQWERVILLRELNLTCLDSLAIRIMDNRLMLSMLGCSRRISWIRSIDAKEWLNDNKIFVWEGFVRVWMWGCDWCGYAIKLLNIIGHVLFINYSCLKTENWEITDF